MSAPILLFIFLLVTGCSSSFGQNPTGEYLERISRSKQFHRNKGKFVNRDQVRIELEQEKRSRFKTITRFMFSGEQHLVPDRKLPEVRPDLKRFIKESKKTKFIWLGHSTFLINLKGKILLFDPMFSDHAAPYPVAIRRFQPPVISLEDLPAIDYVIISHDHYDHLDMDSIKFFRDKKTKFVAPLGVPSHLKFWGIKEQNISELDWWESIKHAGIEFVCTPSQHFSGRSPQRNPTLWSSWVIKTDETRLFYSGDTGYDTHFKTIGKKYGPFEVAFMENGQYNESWPAMHMSPEQTIQAFKDLKGENLISVHWGMFDLSIHNWFDPIERVSELSLIENINHLTPKLGQIVTMDNDLKATELWWKPMLPK